VFSYLQDKFAITELFTTISKAVADRPGGYTRIIKTGFRASDAAPMCFIELVDFDENMAKTPKAAAKKTRRAGRKAKAETVAEAPKAEETAAEAE
jgi:large subunit ribosomal protein L17